MTMPTTTTTTSRSTTLNSTSEEDADDMVAGDLGAGLGKKPGGLVFEEKEASPLQTPAAAVAAGHCKGGGPHDPARALSGGGGGGGHAVNGCVGTRADRLADCELALEVLRHELEHSHEEAEALRRQLEQAHELLEEKDAAIQTLQSKAVFGIATSHCVEKVQRIEESKKSLEKEVNELRWEVESNRERLSSVEKLWLERYDRLCCENEALMASLELRAEEARNLSADNMGLKRQRDELQASLSVRDKRTLLGSCAGLGQRPGGRSEVTPLELAVLGACRCGGTAVPALATGEPCACAWATAAARRKIVELKSQLEELRRREEESVAVGDAYRIAFEQQLCRAATFAARMAPRQRPPSAAGRPLRHNHPAVPAHGTGRADARAGIGAACS
uniref:Coiled-coil domain-containing protein 125 n=1 Tax=Petromyzon marinus TaxID=7757 RepID=A0AAJ7T8K9_PETMA|nr:coiled-coil domain-containing protein 125 [Petromyzon marinus]XP_032812133.1 coiled-coil domain-containing protein 125 [Petromyzon marinus]